MADETTTGTDTQTTPGAPEGGTSPLTQAPPSTESEQKPPEGEQKPAEGEKKPDEKTDDKSGLDIKALKLPEGVTLDEKVAGEFTTILSDTKLSSQDRMQKLVDLHTAELKKVAGQPLDTWNSTVEQWTKEVAADKELGTGVNEPLKAIKPAVVAKLGKVIDMLGGQPLRAALELTGAGYNPAVIKAFAKIADRMTEGSLVPGGGPAPNKTQGVGPSALYPDNPQG